jgi:hypothetical protein
MRTRSVPFTVVALLACLLAVLAGGDDFNLVRIALPFALPPSPGDSLPLDDPNADFTEATQTQVPARSGLQNYSSERLNRMTAHVPITPSAVEPAPRSSVLTPLRC